MKMTISIARIEDLRHDIQLDATVPRWCEHKSDASAVTAVDFSAAAAAALAAAVPRLRFFEEASSAMEAIVQMLQLDIRSVHQGRGQAVEAEAGQQYACRFDRLTVDFTTFATHCCVDRVALEQRSARADRAWAETAATARAERARAERARATIREDIAAAAASDSSDD